MHKKISALILFLFIHTNCSDSNPSELQTPPEPHQNTSESPTDHKIVLETKLPKGGSLTISYSPLYADNIIYSTELSHKGDCLDIRSDYLNAIVIIYKGKELCDNVDAIQKEYCGSGDLKILPNEKGLYIEHSYSNSSYDNCKPFVTKELEKRMEKLHSCIQEFQKYDPNKIPLSQKESIKKTKTVS